MLKQEIMACSYHLKELILRFHKVVCGIMIRTIVTKPTPKYRPSEAVPMILWQCVCVCVCPLYN